MKRNEEATVMRRLGGLLPQNLQELPRNLQEEAMRLARGAYGQLPPVAIQRRIDALERHVDRRFKDLEAKLDALLNRQGSNAA
jgi:hypothetical protein